VDEFIIVTFDRSRKVVIDGAPNGSTNQTLRVSRGVHRIDLGSNMNYEPSFRRPTVTGTSKTSPMIVEFTRIEE
jgi:hypothetical protein